MTSRAHGLVISLVLGFAAAVAAYAVIITGHLGDGSTKPEVATNQVIAARAHKLDAWEESLRKALASRPPAVPAKARFASVVLVSPPGAMALPTPAAIPARRISKPVAVAVKHAVPARARPKPVPVAQPKAGVPAPPRNEDDGKKESDTPVPVQVAAPPPVQVAPPAPASVAAAPTAPATTAPAMSAPTPSAKASAEAECRTILRVAEDQSEKAKQAAEVQCEPLKQAAEKKG